jgi:hypothetical protein
MSPLAFMTRAVWLAVLVGGSSAAGCTFKPAPDNGGGTGGDGITGTGGAGGRFMPGTGTGGAKAPPCMNLECKQTTCTTGSCTGTACTAGARTTVSGTVYDPAGRVPLYNVTVYVPNTPLAAIAEGAACLPCDTATSGSPLVKATTDAAGHFVLDNVPVGSDIPLVIQVGKWRRESKISTVAACVDNPITDKDVTRLPRNQTEGHLPRIALTTGAADALECLLRKIGIDDAEFTPEASTGRVNLFAGGNDPATDATGVGTNAYAATLNAGAPFTRAAGWWDSVDNLKPYDLLLHSCEGTERPTNKSAAALQAFQAYANMGGRAFTSHWHNYWIEHGPAPFPTVARFNHLGIDNTAMTFMIDQTPGFDKGIALAQWLLNVGASTTLGQLEIKGAKHTVDSINAASQRWIYGSTTATAGGRVTTSPSVQYFTFATPIDAAPEAKCGKVVFSDLHVSSGSGAATDDVSAIMQPFPMGCRTTELSPQEKALEFMLFDLSACTVPGIP